MASGLSVPLGALMGAQVLLAIPFALPFKAAQTPTIAIFHGLSSGAGGYIGATLLATMMVLMFSSIWEAMSLQRGEDDSHYKTMMTAVQLARAHLVIALCASNITFSLCLCKLSLEIRAHDKLMKSHSALQRQAKGVSEEYSRITKTDKGTAQSQELQQVKEKNVQLAEQCLLSKREKEEAQKELQDVKMQLKSLENSFDELMKQSMLQSSLSQARKDE